MPIKKLISIENLGRFEKLHSVGDSELRKLTLIYGLNGWGKTTIAALLRSLTTGSPEHLLERQRLGSDKAASAVLHTDGGTLRLNNGTWTAGLPGIEIFDSHFVSRNVHSGERVDPVHRQRMYELAVGPNAVALAEAQNLLDAELRIAKKRLRQRKAEIQQVMHAPFEVDDFINLVSVDGVEELIQSVTARLNAARNKRAITLRPSLVPLSIPELPLELTSLLEISIDKISHDAHLAVQDHIENQLDDRGETWLRHGHEYSRGQEHCPFCAQPLQTSALVLMYSEYFSEKYSAHILDLQNARRRLAHLMEDNALGDFVNAAMLNRRAIEAWSDLVDISEAVIDTSILEASWSTAMKFLIGLIESKLANPTVPTSVGAEVSAALEAYANARLRALEINSQIASANTSICACRPRSDISDEVALEAELRRLANVRLRQRPDIVDLCNVYMAEQIEVKRIADAKTDAKLRLESEACSTMETHEKSINSYLRRFGARFTIAGTRPTWTGGKSSSTYAIVIRDSQPVDVAEGSASGPKPNFGTLLSTGDKTTLALAFFFARLARDPALADKIVVLDDPLSSMDDFRLAVTQHTINALAERVRQVIVLSHNAFFLKSLRDGAKDGGCVKALQIARSETPTCSLIKEWDIYRVCRPEPQQAHLNLVSYLDEGHGADNPITVARQLRVCLEGYFRAKYPNEFGHGMFGTFIERIREAKPDTPLSHITKDELAEIELINEYCRRFHHAPDTGSAPIVNEDELQEYARRTLAFIYGAPLN